MNKLIGFEEVAELTTIPESTIRRMVTGVYAARSGRKDASASI